MITRIGNLRVKFYSVDRLGAVELFNSKSFSNTAILLHITVYPELFDTTQDTYLLDIKSQIIRLDLSKIVSVMN